MPRHEFQTPFTFGPDGHNIARTKIEWFVGPGGTRVPRYVAWSDSNVATSAARWRIMRISYNDGATDNPTDIEWAVLPTGADGDSDFSHVYDDRAVLAYN